MMPPKPMGGFRAATMILCLWNCAAFGGCDRAPAEPTSTSPQSFASGGAGSGGTSGESSDGGSDACVVPLVEPAPPEVASLEDCPPDPMGRPTMPYGVVNFPDAPNAPELQVELALSDTHRAHGLMYRPTLGDEEGMLFSWTTEQQRQFWMKNTCLALDMLFVSKDGTVAGILENVPPWNETPSRTVPCPAAHVLEVRAGWTRTYGVKPGQRMVVSSPTGN